MNFSPIDLDAETRAFWDDVRAFCDEHVTTEVIDEEFRTGAGFNDGLHQAMGARGWIVPTWPREAGGAAATALQAALLSRELRARHAPTITLGTTLNVLEAVVQWGVDDLKADVLPSGGTGRCPLVPGLHRARLRIGYRRGPDPGLPGRRRVGHRGPEDVHHRGPELPVLVPPHPHQPRCTQAQGPYDVPLPAGRG